MDPDEPKLLRSASAKAIPPLFGMLGGLLLGVVWAKVSSADELTALYWVTRWAVTGFFLGLILVVALVSVDPVRKSVASIRRLMTLVVVGALLCWYVVKILFEVLGFTSS